MNYKEIYIEHYNRCYDKTESLIKSYFLKQKKSERTFGYGLQIVKKYLAETVNDKYEFAKEDPLVECYNYFLKRNRLYKSSSSIERILENEIYECFSENCGQEKIPEKLYCNLIKRIAINECVEEITRIISNDSVHLQLFYDYNSMDEFEIRDDSTVQIDNRPKYAKLLKLKWETSRNHIQNIIPKETTELPRYEMNDNCKLLLEHFVDNYKIDSVTKIKYINIMHYLKNDCDKTIFIFNLNQAQFKEMIELKYGVQLKNMDKPDRYEEREKPILRNIETSFVKNSGHILK